MELKAIWIKKLRREQRTQKRSDLYRVFLSHATFRTHALELEIQVVSNGEEGWLPNPLVLKPVSFGD